MPNQKEESFICIYMCFFLSPLFLLKNFKFGLLIFFDVTCRRFVIVNLYIHTYVLSWCVCVCLLIVVVDNNRFGSASKQAHAHNLKTPLCNALTQIHRTDIYACVCVYK